jgi:hypothetical protein
MLYGFSSRVSGEKGIVDPLISSYVIVALSDVMTNVSNMRTNTSDMRIENFSVK